MWVWVANSQKIFLNSHTNKHIFYLAAAQQQLQETLNSQEDYKAQFENLTSEFDSFQEQANLDSAIKEQLEQYGSNAERDAETIDECVNKISEQAVELKDATSKVNKLTMRNTDLQRELEVSSGRAYEPLLN